MARALRVRVDHTRCVGNAMCTSIAPAVFKLNDDRQSEAISAVGEPEDIVLKAAENCPVCAIRVEDAATGEQLF